MGPDPLTGILYEEGNLDVDTGHRHRIQREGHHVKTEAAISVMHLQAKEYQRLWATPEAGKGNEGFFPRTFRNIMAL